MKRHIRRGVFETNSSSTHSLTVCSEDEFEAWKRGELLLDEWNGQFVSAVDLSDYDKQMAKEKYCKTKDEFQKDWDDLSESAKQKYYTHFVKENDIIDEDGKTYDQYMDDGYLEHYSHRYTSKSGDKIVVFGRYGYDG